MIYYLAYGSNLNLRQMRSRCPDSRVIGWARLTGFRLVYRGSKTGSFLSIEPGKWPDPDGLRVGIFEVPRLDELALDCYEGYPAFYQKYRVTLDKVYAFGGSRVVKRNLSVVYYALPTDHVLGLPSRRYNVVCSEGYRDFGFPESQLNLARGLTICAKNGLML